MVTEKSAKLLEHLHFYREMYPTKLVIATAWGYSGMILLDHARKVWPTVPVISINTGFLFAETVEHAIYVTELWNLDVKWDGPRGSHTIPPHKECCLERKVTPMARLLGPNHAWISAIRRDQASTRKESKEVEPDQYGKMRLAPMLEWRSAECWAYIEANKVPVQPLHARGYKSIGCQPCTNLPSGDDERSGRWHGERVECGIHEEKS